METIENIKKIIIFTLILMGAFASVHAEDYNYGVLTETLLNQNPDPVQPGDYVELRFKIEKFGNQELNDIQYRLDAKYPFSFDASDNPIKTLNDWIGSSDKKEYYILYYKLKVDENALEGVYELSLFQTSKGNKTQREIKFNVRVDKKKKANIVVGAMTTSPSKLISDYDEALFKVEFVNNGNAAAENVIAKLNLPKGFEESFGYSNIVNLGTINVGQKVVASFYIDTDKELKENRYLTTVDVQYTEDDGDNKKHLKNSLDVYLKVFGKPEYEIKNFVVTDKLTAGKSGTITFDVKNIGSKKAESVSVQVFKDSTQPFDFEEKTDFIGNLEIGESGNAIIKFDVKENAEPKDYNLDVQIRTVLDGEVLVEEKTIVIPVQEKRQVSFFSLEYILAGLIIVVGFVSYFAGKKSKISKG